MRKLKSDLFACLANLTSCSLFLASSFSFSYFCSLSLTAVIISTTSLSTASKTLSMSLVFSIFVPLGSDYWHWEVSSVFDDSHFFLHGEQFHYFINSL